MLVRYLKIGWLISCIWLFSTALVAASPVTMQINGGNLREVLLGTARLGNFNIILDDAVTGKVSIKATAEPLELLKMISKTQGLLLTEENNTYLITTKAAAANLRSLHTYKVNYADLNNLEQVIKLSGQKEGKNATLSNNKNTVKNIKKVQQSTVNEDSTSNRVAIDKATNTLIFYGNEFEAASVAKLIKKIDVPAKQISLEAKVLALSRQASKEIGVDWEWSKLPQYPERQETYTNEGKSNERRNIKVTRQWKSGESVPGIIQFGHGPEGYPFEFYFSAKLNALVSNGKAKILARPNITTVQGEEAIINIGSEVPVPTQTVSDTTTTTSLTYRQAGIILKCTPRVNDDGFVTAKVHTEVSSPLYVEDIKAYRFQKRSADTMVRLHDGQTMVIGGLIGSEESRTYSKVPFLSEIPLLGQFFRSLKRSSSESELMIFLTAHILNDDNTVDNVNTE